MTQVQACHFVTTPARRAHNRWTARKEKRKEEKKNRTTAKPLLRKAWPRHRFPTQDCCCISQALRELPFRFTVARESQRKAGWVELQRNYCKFSFPRLFAFFFPFLLNCFLFLKDNTGISIYCRPLAAFSFPSQQQCTRNPLLVEATLTFLCS